MRTLHRPLMILALLASAGCQSTPPAESPTSTAAAVRAPVRDFEGHQLEQMPRVGRVGRISFIDVAPGDYGYYNALRYNRLLMACDTVGSQRMIDAGEIVEIPSCRFRVLDVAGDVRDPRAHPLVEVRLEECALEGESAWMYFGPVERSGARWEQ